MLEISVDHEEVVRARPGWCLLTLVVTWSSIKQILGKHPSQHSNHKLWSEHQIDGDAEVLEKCTTSQVLLHHDIPSDPCWTRSQHKLSLANISNDIIPLKVSWTLVLKIWILWKSLEDIFSRFISVHYVLVEDHNFLYSRRKHLCLRRAVFLCQVIVKTVIALQL